MKVASLRSYFPFFTTSPDLIYLDNAATTQLARPALAAINNYYQRGSSNAHRSYHPLANRTSFEVEEIRKKVGVFLNASSAEEIIFTSGTTTSLNLLASSYALSKIQAGDVVWVSAMEHHANFLPWQQLATQKGAHLKVIPLTKKGALDSTYFEKEVCSRSRLLAICHTSNVLGVLNPIKRFVEIAHAYGVKVIVDAAQSVAHHAVDVQKIGCDFLAFSAHKMYGPTGIGILYGKKELLEELPPTRFGGGMIKGIGKAISYAALPQKFEAGTLPIAQLVGLGATIDFLNGLDRAPILQHEQSLVAYARKEVAQLPGCKVLAKDSVEQNLFSFYFESLEAGDLALLLAAKGVAIRAGTLCAIPLLRALSLRSVLRVSLAMYNTKEEVESFLELLKESYKALSYSRRLDKKEPKSPFL